MFRFKLPRWLVVIVGLLALVLMAAPAVRAAAEDGDSSSSPAATTAATQAAEQPKAEETPSPKTSEKADPAPSEDPKPAKTTEAPAPKPSQTKTATKPAKPSASASPTKKASSSSSEADPTASLVGHACVKDAGKLTGEVRISLVFDNTKRTSGEDFSAKFTYGSGEVFTSEQYAEPGELKSLEGDFPAGGTFHVRILWSGSKVLLDESFDTQECVPTTEPTEEPTSTPTVTPTSTPTVEPTVTPTKPAQPDDKVTYTQWVDGEKSCEAKTVTQTRTKTVVAFVWDEQSGKWVEGNPVVTTETQTRAMTPDELKACPVTAPTASLVVRCDKIDGEKTGYVEAELRLDNHEFESASKFLVQTTWPGGGVESELFVGAEQEDVFYGYFPAGGVLRNIVTWEGQVILDQSDNTQKCVVKDEPTPKPTPTKEPTKKPTKSSTTDKTWSNKKNDSSSRGISNNTGPGEEPLVANQFGFVQQKNVAFGAGLALAVAVIVGGVLSLRRKA